MHSYQEALDKLRSDIHMNRSDYVDKDRRQIDQEEQFIQSKKEVISLCLYSNHCSFNH